MADEQDDLKAIKAEQDALTRLDNLDVQAILERGRMALLRRLVARVEANTASKDDMAQLRQLLKDNGMVWGGLPSTSSTGPVAPEEPDDLPTFDDSEGNL